MNSTILNYAELRGDLSSLDYPWNDVDYLIFSSLSYLQLDHLPIEDPMPIQDLYQVYQRNNYQQTSNPVLQESLSLFKSMAESIRYQNILMTRYVSETNENLVKQFSATSYILPNQEIYVAYRGTDDSMIGWHEDFFLLYESEIPSHKQALDYINHIASLQYGQTLSQSLKNEYLGKTNFQRYTKHQDLKKNGYKLHIGGHSKGGHLAIYAAMMADPKIQDRIIGVYNYDGPGVHEDFATSDMYKRILPKIHSYMPEYSFFGMMLHHDEEYTVLKSNNTGMIQHNCFSWCVDRNTFIPGELSMQSLDFTIKVYSFLDKLSVEEKKVFVQTLFQLFDSLDILTFSELSHLSYKHVLAAVKQMTQLDSSVLILLIQVIHMLWNESKNSHISTYTEDNDKTI